MGPGPYATHAVAQTAPEVIRHGPSFVWMLIVSTCSTYGWQRAVRWALRADAWTRAQVPDRDKLAREMRRFTRNTT